MASTWLVPVSYLSCTRGVRPYPANRPFGGIFGLLFPWNHQHYLCTDASWRRPWTLASGGRGAQRRPRPANAALWGHALRIRRLADSIPSEDERGFGIEFAVGAV